MSHDDDRIRLGVDTGGTFTDIIKRRHDGDLDVHKLLSTPEDPSRAIGDGVSAVLDDGELCREVIHGTTVATNALLERKGARQAFVTTAGFEDLLWMRRQARPELYDLEVRVPCPLVAEEMSFGVRERLDARGEIVDRLTDDEVKRIVDEVARAAPEAVVICLLHSYANPVHEEQLAEAFRARSSQWHITVSSEVAATFREYERASTATINGYVGPVMEQYLARLSDRLQEVERLEVLQSHGGRADAEHAGRLPVHTVLSGPAGGVVGALVAAKEIGIERVISFDMGGTSTDVSLADGEPTLTEEGAIGGLALQVPIIDIFTVGAGGGSIAGVDAGGALRVGPESAGADPGPVAYGRGGIRPTVTDAHVVLGSLRPDRFLGGAMPLNKEDAYEAVQHLGDELDIGLAETAQGILAVADATMARAIKVISLERGHDPREYTLVGFGGAGGLHACRLAEALDMSRVLVPRFPGLLSAAGMLQSEAKRLYSKTILRPLASCIAGSGRDALRAIMEELELRAHKEMGDPPPELRWTASLRYQGQSFAIPLAVDWRAEDEKWSDPVERFEDEHDRLYGYRARRRAIELVDMRLEASRQAVRYFDEEYDEEEGTTDDVPGVIESIDLGRGPAAVRVVERADLAESMVIDGPAVITEYSGTTLILDGWRVTVTKGHLVIERGESK